MQEVLGYKEEFWDRQVSADVSVRTKNMAVFVFFLPYHVCCPGIIIRAVIFLTKLLARSSPLLFLLLFVELSLFVAIVIIIIIVIDSIVVDVTLIVIQSTKHHITYNTEREVEHRIGLGIFPKRLHNLPSGVGLKPCYDNVTQMKIFH